MNHVKLIVDSASDLDLARAEEKGLVLVPMRTRIDGVEYRDGVDITHGEFYEKLETCRTGPTTSQIPPQEFAETYASALSPDEEAVVITLSRRLSGTAESAVQAAVPYRGRVQVVDSRNASAGERILIEYALRLRERGLCAKDLAAELRRARERICLVARVETLEYLVKGGRLSRAAGMAGTMLNVKPVIGLVDGSVVILGKALGSRKGNNLLTQSIVSRGGIDFSMPLLLAYTGQSDALLQEYIESSRPIWEGQVERLPVSTMGGTIGTHAGPGAVAVAFFAKE